MANSASYGVSGDRDFQPMAASATPSHSITRRQRVLISRALPKGFVVLGREDLVIGRARECNLSLLADGVSRKHARICFDGSTHTIQDLGSTNGTLLNGEVIQKTRKLDHEDTVGIGPFNLRFVVTD